MHIDFKMIDIEKLILGHTNIFYFFSEVYLFGSSLNNSQYSNDIDLLLVYKSYSQQIESERKIITSILENLFEKDIDITILSEEELKETKFLERLYSPYKKIK